MQSDNFEENEDFIKFLPNSPPVLKQALQSSRPPQSSERMSKTAASPAHVNSAGVLPSKKRKPSSDEDIEEGEEKEEPVYLSNRPVKSQKTSLEATPSRPPSLSAVYNSLMAMDTPWLNFYLTPLPPMSSSMQDMETLRPHEQAATSMSRQNYLLTPAIRQLHYEILAFSHYISPTEQEKAARKACIARIAAALRTVWPTAKVIH